MRVTYHPTSTTVYTSKTYRQCLGKAWPGNGRCSSCGADVSTGGNCSALIEVVEPPAEKYCGRIWMNRRFESYGIEMKCAPGGQCPDCKAKIKVV